MDLVLDLVRLIYDAAWAPEQWVDFLTALQDMLGGVAVVLLLRVPQPGDVGSAFAVGVAPAFVRLFQEEYEQCDAWGLSRLMYPDGAVGVSEALIPAADFRCTAFYNQWMRPQGLRPAPIVGGLIRALPSAVIGTFQPRGTRSRVDETLSLFRVLMPHWQHGLRLHELHGQFAVQRGAGAAAFDQLSIGAVFLDGHGRILTMNRRAESLIAQGDGLQVRGLELVAAHVDESAWLQRLILSTAAATVGGSLDVAGTMRISRPSGRRPFVLRVLPAYRESSSLWPPRVVSVLFLTDPEQLDETDAALIGRLHGLTHAEAQLAALLARGLTLKESAEQLDVRFNTARAHLRRIFDKTGVHHQGALVRLLLSCSRS